MNNQSQIDIKKDKSYIIVEFISKFTNLENLIKRTFINSIPNLSNTTINKLYFIYGGKLNSYYEYEGEELKLNTIKFKEKESFNDISINQIIKIFSKNSEIPILNLEIESLEKKIISFKLSDCVMKLISMRNKLAHEMKNLKFYESKDLIELLSDKKINNTIDESFNLLSINYLDDMTKYILSNIIYMDIIIKILNDALAHNDF